MILIFLILSLRLDHEGLRNKEPRERSGRSKENVQGDQLGLDLAVTASVFVDEKGVKKYQNDTNFTRPDPANKTGIVKSDYQDYNFKDSGIGNSWLLGTDNSTRDESNYANAFIGGLSKCPRDITVPRSLTSKEGVTKPVEVIGIYAYYACGQTGLGSETKTVLVTKQVKIIKRYGFGDMVHVESFRIEEGSILQSIESNGLNNIGWSISSIGESKRGTLTLPSTLSSVASSGIFYCNLFKIIIYCGTHSLTNKCDLETGSVREETKVKVINDYSASTIFGRTPLKDSTAEVQSNCKNMEIRPTPTRSQSRSRSVSRSRSRSRSISPSPSRSVSPTPSCNCPCTPIKQTTIHLALFFALLPSNSLSSSSASLSTSSSSFSFADLLKFVPSISASISVSFPFA